MTEPERGYVPIPGGDVWTLRWPSATHAPWLVFAHATGMCAELYAGLLAPLSDRFRILAFDARGHGRTTLPPAYSPDWALHRADLAALVRVVTPDPVLLAGHSFGASVVAETTAQHTGHARAVAMIEPAAIPSALAAGYRAARDAGGDPPNRMAEQAARRRPSFPDRAAMRAAYAGRGVFTGWPESALDAYLDGGAHATPEGFALRCTPTAEAETFRGVTTTLHASLATLRGTGTPAALLHGTENSTVQPEDAAALAAQGTPVHRLDNADHFLPITHADETRAWLFEALS